MSVKLFTTQDTLTMGLNDPADYANLIESTARGYKEFREARIYAYNRGGEV